MSYDHLKANAAKSKRRVYDKLNKAYAKYTTDPETKGTMLSVNKLSKLAGVDRSWSKKEHYAKIKNELTAYNAFITRKDVKRTAKDVQASRLKRLEEEVEILKAEKIRLLQQNALYLVEADYFEREAKNKAVKIKKLQEQVAVLTRRLNASTLQPIELDDYRG